MGMAVSSHSGPRHGEVEGKGIQVERGGEERSVMGGLCLGPGFDIRISFSII